MDASPWGCGICAAESTPSQLAAVGAHSERWRFKNKEPPVRVLARGDICSAIALEKGKDAADDFLSKLHIRFPHVAEEDLHAATDALSANNHVPLIDVDSLPAAKPWRVVSSFAWQREEHISVLETRTLVATVRHAVYARGLRNCRLVIISDSMAAILSGSKGRSSRPGMCRALRQLSALLIFGNLSLSLRWVPSEVNHADVPSRRGQGSRRHGHSEPCSQERQGLSMWLRK